MVIIGGDLVNKFIHSTPNFLYEATAFIEEQYFDRLSSIIEKYEKFGITKDEMENKFINIKRYKAALEKEILPIYDNYKKLQPYFKTNDKTFDTNASIALTLVLFFGESMSSKLSYEEIDEIMNKYIISIIENLLTDSKKSEIEIANLEDLINLLNGADTEDSMKIQLINLYYNRYDVIEKLQELLSLCVPICEKYFYIVKEDFDRAQSFLNEKDSIEDFLQSSYDLKISIPEAADIYYTIFTFNSLTLTEVIDGFTFYIGIYFFDIFELKIKNRFNDIQIVADLKSIGDPTRLKIIHLLASKKMYIQELAQELELTPATVSHHINILLKSELISLTVDAVTTRKIYYEVNPKKFESLGETIKSLSSKQLPGGNILEEKN